MIQIFRSLGKHWKTCLLVFALLLLQANCDLSLPSVTSDIVDVGIQMGGVESNVPATVQADTLEALEWLMEEQTAAQVEAAYSAPNADGIRKLTGKTADLEDAFTMPNILLYMMASQNGGATPEALAQAAAQLNGLPAQLSQTAEMLRAAAAGKLTPEQATAMQSGSMMPGGFAASEEDSKAMMAALASYTGTPEETRAFLQNILGKMSSMLDESTLELMASQAKLLVRLDYEAQSISQKTQMGYLVRQGALMLGYTLVLVGCAVGVGFLASRTSAAIGRDLRQDVFRRVVSFSNAEMDQFSTASLITRTTNDIQQVQFVCVMLLRMVLYSPILGVGGIVKVAQTGSSLTWIIVLTVCTLLAVIAVMMVIAMPKFQIMQTLVDRVNLVSREILNGIMPIRAFSRESFEEARFDVANRDLMKTQLFTNRAMAGMMPFMTVIMNGASLMIVWFGGKAMDTGSMQVGDMIAFLTYTMQIVMSFLMLTMVAIMLPRAGVAAKRIDEVLKTESSIHDPESTKAPKGIGEVVFDHVSFRYPGSDANVLEDISFTASPGQTVAIIGATGAGKSTLLNLIPRFFDVTEGRVTVDGVDVREMSQKQLHALMGYVPQKAVLFSGTIDSNLKFAGPEITDDRARKAARIAQAVDFIEAKPEGYESAIAQGGTNVSGGQKQRLSIARAIAKDPKIYLFDDSFSALDFKTDVALRRALNQETDNATVIIVAQRISTVLHADCILVLEEGRIVGQGTHAQLMQSCPTYQEIARSQLSQKELGIGGEE